MDIREAKEQIRRCVQIYLAKDAYGNYRIPVEKQRPVFLLGAPGIGKTAIMEQISQETGLPLVAYSMTHHTRQSALGLPIIVDRTYQGKQFSVSEYTLSEIISALYTCMEQTGSKEGILFLDEINCVSETLAPSMLQFLQYKTFGNHRIPEGWVLVTAGNPPQYNRAVREFDIVTLDRLKVLEIQPDFPAWQRYAREAGVHRAIQSFLNIRRELFYRIENTREGRQYVTARGWEDLSEAIRLYEENRYPVDAALITQYIRFSRAADEFATYYALYCKYRGEYPVQDILAGTASQEVTDRARAASLDERITVLQLLLEALLPGLHNFMTEEAGLKSLQKLLRDVKGALAEPGAEAGALLEETLHTLEEDTQRKEAAEILTRKDKAAAQFALSFLKEQHRRLLLSGAEAPEPFSLVQAAYMDSVQAHKAARLSLGGQLDSLFAFVETCWGPEKEMLILTAELTADPGSMAFLYAYGCQAYDRYSEKLQMSERRQELSRDIEAYLLSEAPETAPNRS